MRGKVLDIETSTDKLLHMFSEKLDSCITKVDRMEEGHILRAYTDEQVKIAKDEVNEKIYFVKEDYCKKFIDLTDTHLVKPGLIGTDEDCKFKTLMDYTTTRIPENIKKLKYHDD